MMDFLTAHWNHLLLANFCVDRNLLVDLLPDKTSIDEFEGHVFVSLVAFLFDKTRVLGIPIPFHRRFEEVNLRFYVTPDRDPSIRAVSFIKEIVPKRAITWIANTLFSENYEAQPMGNGRNGLEYWYSWGAGGRNRFSAKLRSELEIPAPGSIAEFITEHYWGYARGRKHTLEYRVKHPQWRCSNVDDFDINVDFGQTYGERFACLNGMQPHSVQYAEGSPVSVSFPRRLKST